MVHMMVRGGRNTGWLGQSSKLSVLLLYIYICIYIYTYSYMTSIIFRGLVLPKFSKLCTTRFKSLDSSCISLF